MKPEALLAVLVLTSSSAALACEPVLDLTLRGTVCFGGARVMARAVLDADDRFVVLEILEDGLGLEGPVAPLDAEQRRFRLELAPGDEALLWLDDFGRPELELHEVHPIVDGRAIIHGEAIALPRLAEALEQPSGACSTSLRDEGFRDASPDTGICPPFGCGAARATHAWPFALLALLALRRRRQARV